MKNTEKYSDNNRKGSELILEESEPFFYLIMIKIKYMIIEIIEITEIIMIFFSFVFVFITISPQARH